MTEEKLKQVFQLLDEVEAQVDEPLRQKLQAAKTALDEMVDENSKFISVMVHEVKKPMTSIRGYADMLAKNVMGELNEMQSQFAHTIRNNVISMDQLVTDISDISKLQSGRIQPDAKMEMFKNIAMQLEKDTRELAEARGVTLVFDIPQGLPLLNLDGKLVEKALRKIIENSIRYTPENEGQVTLQAESMGATLRVTVTDNGVGISEADQQHLGELFFRGDQELVTQTKGYGMGLPIAFACLKKVGGELHWESREGLGTIFEVILPAMTM